MRNQSLYRIGGSALALGAVMFAAGVALHAPQPQDLAAYATTPHGTWMLSHWLLALSQVFTVAGTLALARHLFGTNGDGWATLGLACSLVTGALFVVVVAPEIAAFPALAQGADAGAQHAFNAVNANLMSLVYVGVPLFWLGFGCFALALQQDATFPRWVGQAGVVMAVVQIVAHFANIPNWVVARLIFIVGAAWIAYVGYALSKVKAAAGAPVGTR
jgi:hypothetical protein